MKSTRKIFTLAALTLLTASSVYAEQASDSVDAKAGLQPALELTCTDVSFGVWRVPIRSSGGTTTITLSQDTDEATIGGSNVSRVAQSNSGTWLANRGLCTLSGSTAANATVVAITKANSTDMALSGAADGVSGYAGLDAPTTAASLVATLDVPTTATMNSEGEATFHIGGVLTIPQNIIANNYGGYKTTTAATITADDGEGE